MSLAAAFRAVTRPLDALSDSPYEIPTEVSLQLVFPIGFSFGGACGPAAVPFAVAEIAGFSRLLNVNPPGILPGRVWARAIRVLAALAARPVLAARRIAHDPLRSAPTPVPIEQICHNNDDEDQADGSNSPTHPEAPVQSSATAEQHEQNDQDE